MKNDTETILTWKNPRIVCDRAPALDPFGRHAAIPPLLKNRGLLAGYS